MAKNTQNTENESVKDSNQVLKQSKHEKKDVKPSKKKTKAEDGQKRNKLKETFAELKKVTWPSFGKAMKQTGMVLTIVLIFGVVVLGIDLLISWIINLLSNV